MSVIVTSEDTIMTLAHRALSDVTRWHELVVKNDLDYPYVGDETLKQRGIKVLAPGDRVLLPGEDVTDIPGAYGRDLSWGSKDFEVQLYLLEPSLDIGIINLAKAVFRRIVTPKGGLKAHPQYGCSVFQHIGKESAQWRAQLAAIDIKEAILADPRVVSTRVTAEFRGQGELSARCIVTPIPPGEIFEIPLVITPNAGASSSALVEGANYALS